MERVGVDLVTAGSGHLRTTGSGNQTTVYVEADDEDMSSAVVTCGPHGGLQLTTITVAVPAPLSPSDPTAVLQAVAAAAAAAGPQHQHHHHQQHQQQHHQHHPPTITLPSVPAPQETLKWKFDPPKDNKNTGGSSLVRNKLLLGPGLELRTLGSSESLETSDLSNR